MRSLRPLLVAILIGAVPALAGSVVNAREAAVGAIALQSAPSRDQIIEELQRRYRARVVRVDDIQVDGRAAYEVRLLSDADARVWTVRVDAASGRELPRS